MVSGMRRLALAVTLAFLLFGLGFAWFAGLFERQDSHRTLDDPSNDANAVVLLARAERAADANNMITARRLFADVLRIEPDNAKAILYMASFLEEDNNPTGALDLLSRIEDQPANFAATARYMEGNIYLQQNDAREAESRFRQATELNPRYAPPVRKLVRLYALQLRAESLVDGLRMLQVIRPLSVDEQAMMLLAGRPIIEQSQAIPILDAFLKKQPEDVQSVMAIARYDAQKGDFDGAQKTLESHATTVAQHDDSRALWAFVRFQSDRSVSPESLPVVQHLSETSPREAWLLVAHLASDSGNWKTTAEIYEYLLSRQPYSISASHGLATALDRLNRATEAASQHKVTSDLDQLELLAYRMLRPQALVPEMAIPVMCEISDLLTKLNHREEAVAWLSLGLSISPGNVDLHTRIAASRQAISDGAQRKSVPVPKVGVISDKKPDASARETTNSASDQWIFRDVAANLGLDFEYHNGRSVYKRILETIGGGSAVVDLDGDLWPDLYLPQGQFHESSPENLLTDRIYRNLRGEAFADCTDSTGIVETGHSLAATVADFDNDGFSDVFVANAGACRLFHNLGDGTFSDVTPEAVAMNHDCSSCACFVDLNADGWLDLFVVSYVADWERKCLNSQGQYATCDPREFERGQSRVYQNTGDGGFFDATESSGLAGHTGRGLGVIAADLTCDGQPDIFVANDGTPNSLFRNESSGDRIYFQEVGVQSGVAVDENGRSQAGMGVALADFDNNGLNDIFVTNFYREQNTLYSGLTCGVFMDQSRFSGLGPPALELLGFGTQAIDIDCDGDMDLVILNGDIDDYSASGRPWKMPAAVFQNDGSGHFADVSQFCGDDLRVPQLGRGLTRIDFDGDHVDDLVAVRHDGKIRLLKNDTLPQYQMFGIRLHSRFGNADAIGATGSLAVGSEIRSFGVISGDGFSASNQRKLSLPLASGETTLQVRWQGAQTSLPVRLSKPGTSVCLERAKSEVQLWYLPY